MYGPSRIVCVPLRPAVALVAGLLVAAAGPGCGGDSVKTRAPQLVDTADPLPQTDDDTPAPWGPMPAAARRLTDARYRASVASLLDLEYAGDLPLDYDLHGYVTVGAAGVTVSPYDLEIYEAAAWSLAQAAVPSADARDLRMGCAVVAPPADADRSLDLGCIDRFVTDLLERGFRRPPTAEEVDTLRDLYVEVAELASPDLATQAVIASVLLSPHFLYIVEVGATDPDVPDERVLTEWELASRLSYFLTDAPPDAELRSAIGTLHDPEVRSAHAARLLATEAGRAASTRFFVETLDLDRLDAVDKDAELYPTDSPSLRSAMVGELTALWQQLALEEDADLRLLLTSEAARVTPELAALYGIDDVASDTWVTLPADQARGGLLGRAGFSALQSTATRTSPTFRGKFVRMRLLCEDVPPPPEDVIPSLDGASGEGTLREQLEQHMNDPACLPCHQMMDPLGFGLEHLDALGRWRDTDGSAPVDASGDLDGVPFTDARGLGAAVAADPRFGSCLARQLHRHAVGGLEGERQEAEVADLGAALQAGGHRLSTLVAAIVASDGFARVAAPTTETSCESPGATRPCAGSCSDGVETCVGEIWQGCTATSAPHEACDGVDADCDGIADDVVASCPDGIAVCTDGELEECVGLDRSPRETCDGVDNDGDGTIDGDHGIEHAMAVDVITVPLAAVSAAHEGCDPLAADTTLGACGAAANRICAAAGCGLSTGYGPVAIDLVDDRASFVCLDAEHAVTVSTTFSELQSHHGGCSVADPVSPSCNASIHRSCRARGLHAGFGSLEHGSETVLVACTPTAEVFQVPYDALTTLDAECSWPDAIFDRACRGAMHTWCVDQGFATGHGPLENWEGDAWIACIPAPEASP